MTPNGEQLGPRRRMPLQVLANTAVGIAVGLAWLGVSVGNLVGGHLDLATMSALVGVGFTVAGCRSSVSGAQVRGKQLVVRGALRTHRVELTDIARCERAPMMMGIGRYDAAYVVTVSGRRIRVPLLQSSIFRGSSEQLDDEIAGLQSDIAEAVAAG